MASTNKTPGLNLSQYEGSDKFERVDYNADMLKIDETANTLNNGLNSLGNGLSTAHSLAAQANGAAQQSLGTAEYAREQAQSAREFAGQAMSLASNAMTSAAGITVNNIPRTDAYGDIPLTLDNVPDGDTRKLGDAQSIAGVAVDLDGLGEGQTLVYDGESFVPADGGTGDASSIDGIPVDLTGMTGGQTLVLEDGTLVPGSGGGGSSDDVWLPTVSEEGVISWERSPSTSPPTSRNINGSPGADGAPGTDGAPGADGTDGAKWYTGETAPTGINTGDYWLSSASETLGNVYEYDGEEWVPKTNIKGQLQTDALHFTATLDAEEWSGTAPYTQTVTVTGMLAGYTPIADLVLYEGDEDAQEESWAYVSKIETGTDEITVTCRKEVPTVDLNIQMVVV